MAAKDTVTRILISAKDEASGVFTSLQKNAGKVATAIAGYFTAKLFGDSVKSAEALDVQMRKLEGVIEATGGAAGLTAEEIDTMARRLDEATTGSAAGFRDAAAQLLTFKSVGKDAFETTLLLAQDLADAGFGSVTTNAVQLGKALEDPVKGMTALTRSGVTFTDEQQNVVKSLVETGRAAEAQQLILQAVAGQVGGVASAMGGGLTGAIDLVNKRFTDLKEQLGSAILPVFTEFNTRLADLYGRLTDSGAVKTFGEAIASAFQAAQNAFFQFFDNFDLDAVIVSLKDWASTTKETVEQWGQYLSTASDLASTAFNAIATAFNTVKAGAFSVSAIIAQSLSTITGAYASLLETLAKVVPAFKTSAEQVRNLSESFGETARINLERATDAANDTQAAFGRTVDSLKTLVGAEDAAATSAQNAAQAIAGTGQAAELSADQLDALGENMEFVDGASRGAAAGIDTVANSARGLAGNLDLAGDEALALANAFDTLKVESTAALQATADKARTAFETIRNAGTASTRDIEAAFRAYAQTAIAANDGVVSATLAAEARMLGLKVEADDTGKVIVEAMNAGADATAGVGDAADRSAGSVRNLRRELQGLQSDQQGGRPPQQDGDVDPVNNVIDRRPTRTESGRTGTQFARSLGIKVDNDDIAALDEAFNEAYTERHDALMARYSRMTMVSRDQYIRDMQRAERDALSEAQKQVDQKRAEADAAALQTTTTAKPSATGSSSGLSGPQGPAKSTTYTVNVSLGGKATPINVTSDADALALITMLQDIEARA